MADVVCLGILVADVIGRTIDTYPQRGELTLVDEMFPAIGGCAANTGIGLARLGVSTAAIGKVGRDGFGDFVRTILEENGLGAEGVKTDEKSNTSATMVIVAGDGERSFLHHLGANATFTEEDVDWDIVANAKLLHIAGHFLMPAFDGEPCARVLARAQSMGVKTCLDTAFDSTGRWMELLRPTLPYLDYFVPSFSEARRCVDAAKANYPDQVARVFLDEGVGTVALKMGEEGSYITDGKQELRIAPYRVQAIDANGAGDAFAAGFIGGIINGFDLERTGKLASAVGACCVTGVGTTAGLRSMEETLAFMSEQDNGK